jgi:hypothetical protein
MKALIGTVFAVALLAASAAGAAEYIEANAVRFGPAAGNSGFLKILLDRYSTDEERAAWREAFAAGGQDELVKRWQKDEPNLGNLSFARTMGYEIRAAISVPTETGRRIFIATDRPIAGIELLGGTRSEDYPIAWIQIDVDAEGKGEGQMVGAAELAVEGNSLVVKTFGTEPTRLVNVRVREKKQKEKK